MRTVIALIALALLPVAAARAEPVESGSVELNLTSGLAEKLKQEGVLLSALKPGQTGRAAVTLPITNALLEPRSGNGCAFLGGGFRLQDGKRKVLVKSLVLDVDNHSLRAKVDGAALKIATLPPQQSTS